MNRRGFLKAFSASAGVLAVGSIVPGSATPVTQTEQVGWPEAWKIAHELLATSDFQRHVMNHPDFSWVVGRKAQQVVMTEINKVYSHPTFASLGHDAIFKASIESDGFADMFARLHDALVKAETAVA